MGDARARTTAGTRRPRLNARTAAFFWAVFICSGIAGIKLVDNGARLATEAAVGLLSAAEGTQAP